jgi:hypothetical protein
LYYGCPWVGCFNFYFDRFGLGGVLQFFQRFKFDFTLSSIENLELNINH